MSGPLIDPYYKKLRNDGKGFFQISKFTNVSLSSQRQRFTKHIFTKHIFNKL